MEKIVKILTLKSFPTIWYLWWWKESWSLAVFQETFPQFAQCFYDNMDVFCVELLGSWLDVNAWCLASSTREQKVFRGRNVHVRKTSWAGVWRQKQQKLSPHKKIPYLQCQCNQNTLQNNVRLLPGLPHMQRCMTSCMFTNSRGQQRCWCPMYFGVWADEFV